MNRIFLVAISWGAILLSVKSQAQSNINSQAQSNINSQAPSSIDSAAYAARLKKDSMMPKIEFGVKLGVNLQSISSNKTWDNNFQTGFVGGITLGMHHKKAGVQAEVLISTTSFSSPILVDSATNNKDLLRAVSINIPVLFEYSFIPKLKLQIGLQYTNMISVKSTKGYFGDPKVFFKQTEFSGVIGLEAKLSKHLNASARYLIGLTNINNDWITPAADDPWKTQAIQICVGYKFQ